MLHTLSAAALVRLLENRETTSVAIVEALYARADAVDGRLHAWAVQLRRDARREAEERDAERARGHVRGPLHGLPVTIKENIDVAGAESTLGFRARAGRRVEKDALTVRLLRDAGAVVLGKGNVPQTLMAPEATNTVYGTTNNPWDVSRAPGGSSGGEAALLASGQSVLGVGTDIGGSIRIPVGFCGVVGLKPTWGRWSNWGSSTGLLGQELIRGQMGPMARTVDDVVRLFLAVDPLAAARIDPEVPPAPLGDPTRVDLRGLRIGYYERDGVIEPSLAIARAVREAVDALRDAGAELVPFTPPNADEIYLLCIGAFSSDGMRTIVRALEGEPIIAPLRLNMRLGKLTPGLRRAAVRTAKLLGEARAARAIGAAGERTVTELWQMNARRQQLKRLEAEAWANARVDALVCPGYATPAIPHGASGDFSIGAAGTLRYNLLDLPAGVLPVTRVKREEAHRETTGDRFDKAAARIDSGSAGLPAAVQVVARPYREDVALAVMKAIEERVSKNDLYPTTPI